MSENIRSQMCGQDSDQPSESGPSRFPLLNSDSDLNIKQEAEMSYEGGDSGAAPSSGPDGFPLPNSGTVLKVKEESERSYEGGESNTCPSSGFLAITPVTAVCVKEEITPVCVKEEEEITPVCFEDERETCPVNTKEEGAAYSTDNQEPERRKCTIGLKRMMATTSAAGPAPRKPPFSRDEMEILRRSVEEHKDFLFPRQGRVVSMSERRDHWEQVASAVNHVSTVHREIIDLKRRWNDVLRVERGSRSKWRVRDVTTTKNKKTKSGEDAGGDGVENEGQDQSASTYCFLTITPVTAASIKEDEEITPVCFKDEGETCPVSTKEEGDAYHTDHQEPERRKCTIGLKREDGGGDRAENEGQVVQPSTSGTTTTTVKQPSAANVKKRTGGTLPSSSGKRPAAKTPGGQQAAKKKFLSEVIVKRIQIINQQSRQTRQDLTQLRKVVDTLQENHQKFQERCEEKLNIIIASLHTVPGTVSATTQAACTQT